MEWWHVCDVSCAEGYILYLPQKHNVIDGVQVLFYFIVILKLHTVHRLREARLMCTNNHIVFSHPPWWFFCYMSVWCNIIYCCLNTVWMMSKLGSSASLDPFQCIACRVCICVTLSYNHAQPDHWALCLLCQKEVGNVSAIHVSVAVTWHSAQDVDGCCMVFVPGMIVLSKATACMLCVCVKRIFAGSLYLGREQALWNTGQQSPYPVRQQSLSSGCVVQSMCAEFPCYCDLVVSGFCVIKSLINCAVASVCVQRQFSLQHALKQMYMSLCGFSSTPCGPFHGALWRDQADALCSVVALHKHNQPSVPLFTAPLYRLYNLHPQKTVWARLENKKLMLCKIKTTSNIVHPVFSVQQ